MYGVIVDPAVDYAKKNLAWIHCFRNNSERLFGLYFFLLSVSVIFSYNI